MPLTGLKIQIVSSLLYIKQAHVFSFLGCQQLRCPALRTGSAGLSQWKPAADLLQYSKWAWLFGTVQNMDQTQSSLCSRPATEPPEAFDMAQWDVWDNKHLSASLLIAKMIAAISELKSPTQETAPCGGQASGFETRAARATCHC